MSKRSVLLIDDKPEVLAALKATVSKRLGDRAELRTWCPKPDDAEAPEEKFAELADASTAFVATDYDLTGNGVKGFFGLTVVGWCQARWIPVGDFSRGDPTKLPKEPNLFELRIPPDDERGGEFIAAAFDGFEAIRDEVSREQGSYLSEPSLADTIARVIGRPDLNTALSLYVSQMASVNSVLMDYLRQQRKAPVPERLKILRYVIGHTLLNSVLKFPGPILTSRGLAALMGTIAEEEEALSSIFAKARYAGPFAKYDKFYWRDQVDTILSELDAEYGDEEHRDAEQNRFLAEAKLNRELARNGCGRCDGRRGGHLCPFTDRTVCSRDDCSVAASSWIPNGSDLCRVERDYYDEWAPLIGF